ncbi:carbohydrate-binding family V/XII [Bdellovibrio sp. HCB290]|uniref:carbohydrate-binding family V/XII n=1 Tax=Bdellovibrio sp. HCB290 TaxID=3394356 RepID=UPI0039B50C6F
MGLKGLTAICFILHFGSFAHAATKEKTSASSSAATQSWPIEVALDSKQKVTLFQPQVESIENNLITARTAFKLQKDGKDSFGSFLMKADSMIDKDQATVTLRTIKVADMQLPGDTSHREELTREFEKSLNKKQHVLPYRNVVASLELSSLDKKRKSPDLKNDPPQIIFSTTPSLLIMISGNPVMGPSGKYKTPERVVNTSALILKDSENSFYLWALGKWFSAPSATGPFTPTKSNPTSKITMVKDELVDNKTVDPLAGRTAQGNSIYPPGVTPKIFIATKPTELLQSEGEPKFSAVEKTGLLYVSNSPNSVFLETSSQTYYTLISGRWFNAKSLQGPWKHVPGGSLPKDFAKIPTNSPVAEVLVSVPGTPQAKEALITSQIPQTAQVARTMKPKDLKCDGPVKWQKISSTSLQYAENCNTPLIMVNPQQYYIVQDGVWFNSSKESGPWEVSIAVPDQIYQIPTSSPLYYVTYVKIYSTSPDYVVVGYTPGYHGTFVSADGTIVYGTGYSYAPYTTATAWYPPPATYGFGVGYGWGYDSGFYMGFSMGAVMYPWGWGSCCWGGTYVNIDVTNIYHNWGKTSVITGSGGHGMVVNTIGDTKFARGIGSDNVYASHDGGVYRRNGKGDWSQYNGPNTWTPVERPDNIQNLERNHEARATRPDMPHTNRGAAPPSPSNSNYLRGGGGARAGGGFHGGGGGFRR